MNILESCTHYTIDLLKLFEIDSKKAEEILSDYGLDADTHYFDVLGTDLDDFPTEVIDYSSAEFDNYELEDLLNSYLGNHPHYLVFASGCRWNGASGYKFCENITDTVARNYDVTLDLQESVSDRAIKCRESSHDVPMGSTTIIVGISEDEYDDLSEKEFKDVEDFAMNIFK